MWIPAGGILLAAALIFILLWLKDTERRQFHGIALARAEEGGILIEEDSA